MREARIAKFLQHHSTICSGKRNHWVLITALPMLTIALPTFSSDVFALPDNLEKMVVEKISSTSAEEREMVAAWSPGKKLADFFCKKRALTGLEKSYAGADRVFLSISDDEQPQFVTQNRIKGEGSVRHDAGWTNILYQCEVDLQTGKSTEFVFEEAN